MPRKFAKVLVIEDEPGLTQVLRLILRSEGYDSVSASTGDEGLSLALNDLEVDLVLTDVRLPGMSGIEILKRLKVERPHLTVIVMSAYSSIELAVEAMQHGANHFISKPFKKHLIIEILRQAEERVELIEENRRLRSSLVRTPSAPEIVGDSPLLKGILGQLDKVGQFGSSVLLQGESGTGKELLARYLHRAAGGGPFVAVNCGAISPNLLESELFGHVKGAFTGAYTNKEGLFRQADGGTLFLDEIGDLPLELQVKLLRVIQESKVRPVGDHTEYSVTVRIISATAKELSQEVAEGRFREDLFYRLNVVPIIVPALRDRRDDIPLLLQHFMARACHKAGVPVKQFTKDAEALLVQQPWRGNIRELQNLMERLAILSDAEELTVDDLPFHTVDQVATLDGALDEGDLSIKKATRKLERILIVKALKKSGGRKGKAAEMLEISKRALLYKMKEYKVLPKSRE